MAKKTQDLDAAAEPPRLRLVPPVNFIPPGTDADKSAISPSTDLTHVLAESDFRKRYREGRYKPGQNCSLKLSYWPTTLSVTSSLIARATEPRVSISVVSCAALHIGVLDIAQWPAVQKLTEAHETFILSAPRLQASTVYIVADLFASLKPRSPGWAPRSLTISETIDDDLRKLSGVVGISVGLLASLAIMLTLSCQPHKYANKEMVMQTRSLVREFRQWLGWKADVVASALERFESEEAND